MCGCCGKKYPGINTTSAQQPVIGGRYRLRTNTSSVPTTPPISNNTPPVTETEEINTVKEDDTK